MKKKVCDGAGIMSGLKALIYTVMMAAGMAFAQTGPVVVPIGSIGTVPFSPFPHASGALAATSFSTTANKASVYGTSLSTALYTTQISYDVTTADTTSGRTYDIGLYSGSSGGTCSLLVHTGAAPASMTAGWHTIAWTATPISIAPQRIYVAWTSSGTSATAVLEGDTTAVTYAAGIGNVSIATGGTLPATFTCPTDSYVVGPIPFFSAN
jgi:hypothetical protein